MRPPPMQKAALQQNNEVHVNQQQRQRQLQQQQLTSSYLQLQQQQYQHKKQQQITPLTQLQQTSYEKTDAAHAPKYSFEQHAFTVDKPLNFVAATRTTTTIRTAATATANEADITTAKVDGRRNSIAAYAPTTILPVDVKTKQEQIQQLSQRQHLLQKQQQHQPQQLHPQPQRANADCVQLLDLSTSPPHETIYPLQGSLSAYFPQRPLVDAPLPPYRRASTARATTLVPTHRASYASQYSRSSSSEEGSFGGGNGSGGGGGGTNSSSASSGQHFINSYMRTTSSAFDDAAEHFIINFPAADSPSHSQKDCVINLPLSETEPLLTTNEVVVEDKLRRSITLPKNNGGSLIFTKKDLLPQRSASVAPYHVALTNNNCATKKQLEQQQQEETHKQIKQQKRNQSKNQEQAQSQQQLLHHSLSLRSVNENVATRKPAKHLPASYQQQQQQQYQRRSLQLNYNNNLVTTSTCCSTNNNFSSNSIGVKVVTASGSGDSGSKHFSSIGSVLRKHHHATTTTATANVIPQQQQQSGQSNTNTAATTRKQLAYSWYAPVYSALEEELEQDSRDSSPIHNLANTKKQHVNHYQHHRSTSNSSTAVDNETVALLDTRKKVNVQAQLHAQANSHAHAGKDGSFGSGNGIHVGGAGGVGSAGSGPICIQQKNGSQGLRPNGSGVLQVPTTLPLTNAHNATLQSEMAGGESTNKSGGVRANFELSNNVEKTALVNGYDADSGLVNSLSGALPPRRRIENFLKSLVGRKSARNAHASADAITAVPAVTRSENIVSRQPMPASPEITITKTPSEQNLVLLRGPALRGRQYKQHLLTTPAERNSDCSSDKLTVNGAIQGSTSSLNVVQQKLWNLLRREGSAASLYNEKSNSIVQYRGLRKCETVLALTRQTNSLCSPIFGGSAGGHLGAGGKYTGSGSCNGVARHNSCSAGGAGGRAAVNGSGGMRRTQTTGSGIFSTTGVEQIRPLNRLRNSVTNVNVTATCSRCSSLLSLAASGSRYSLNASADGSAFLTTSASQHQLQALAMRNAASPTLECKPPPHSSQLHREQQRERKISNVSSSQLNNNFNLVLSNRNADTNNAVDEQQHHALTSGGVSVPSSSSGNCSRTSSTGAPSTHSANSITPPSNITMATLTSSITSPQATTPNTPTAANRLIAGSVVALDALGGAIVTTPTAKAAQPQTARKTTRISSYSAITSNSNTSGILVDLPSTPTSLISPLSAAAIVSASSASSTPSTSVSSSSAITSPAPTTYILPPTTSQTYPFTITSLLAMSKSNAAASITRDGLDYMDAGGGNVQQYDDDDAVLTIKMPSASMTTAGTNLSVVDGRHYGVYATAAAPTAATTQQQQQTQAPQHFQSFTCKLCLVDVETREEATTLHQCGCEFCTECMKAYVDFEITEGAYEISCPDAQCPAQGIMTLAEIANLTTTNLMKKHHRYRLNKEIEMDKTRTWCPRAGCETVCLIGAGPHSDATPSTSTGGAGVGCPKVGFADSHGNTQQNLCAVQCPSCKDEFCSACKKAWHPNMTCEDNSRRLVADGQDDIGIPFDNDLIKCCPMCAVPIEKDEGCAQMMCKRCKHVFCWYCLASLDDDFLLRHYDRGPCKNKLGHSRASVVWHRAQVIGIFAGFGILLLVASPLLLLAAPCIICCKCRSCSGARIDEGDTEIEEATVLRSP
ncbi:putative mediator of RNA polymerase II transcription subunit 26 isoform X2 [Eurosta solidaginis]|uniref:putative mediator of RNA polymerase II transcription subunit 26 isoform X2 n=1 Tax=Eurosta solidaginis TaxID=178769 RepID=UPI003530E73B